MSRRDAFSGLHPVLNFFWFLTVLVITMLEMHPVFLGISLCSACIYAVYLKGKQAVRFQLCAVLPLLVLAAVMNPLFNHAGMTMLFYLNNGNPVTLEALSFGLAAACMLAAMMIWFSCFHVVMTSDKFIYLFGRIIPALSLLLSMALRFVPRFHRQIRQVTAAQRAIGRDVSSGTIWKRALCGLRILSVTITWALENAVTTADSMKSRGYATRRRTAYAIYRFDRRDWILLGLMAALGLSFVLCLATGQIYIRYFPRIRRNALGGTAVLGYLTYGAFCNLPMLLNGKEAWIWRRLRSNI